MHLVGATLHVPLFAPTDGSGLSRAGGNEGHREHG